MGLRSKTISLTCGSRRATRRGAAGWNKEAERTALPDAAEVAHGAALAHAEQADGPDAELERARNAARRSGVE